MCRLKACFVFAFGVLLKVNREGDLTGIFLDKHLLNLPFYV